MNRLPLETRIQMLTMLVEGSSMRSISRITGTSINTVTKLLVDAGTVATAYHDERVREVRSSRVQCDEIWSFCYAKAKNAPAAMKAAGTAGDCWTWTALGPNSKLIITWRVGSRDTETGAEFMHDLAFRLADRVQLTTDGFPGYLKAVEKAFGTDIDYGQLVKIYAESGKGKTPERKYSPGICCGAHKDKICGKPDQRHISTSHVERQNLTMRMSMRRFTRLTNGHSKKVENHCHALALYFLFYNWIRPHKSLDGRTPAMASNLAIRPLTMAELVTMIDRKDQPETPSLYPSN
jgi:IS1 family transposase